MGLHQKHAPLDVLVHVILTCSMLSCAVCTACEAAWQSVPLLTAGRIASMYLQGAWFLAAAHTMYESESTSSPQDGALMDRYSGGKDKRVALMHDAGLMALGISA